MRFAVLLLILGCLMGAAASAHPSDDTFKVIRVTPSRNDLQHIEQIRIQFSQPLLKRSIHLQNMPIRIEPEVHCQWQWVAEDTLACQVQKPLTLSTKYTLIVFPSLLSETHAELSEPFSHSFITERPTVSFQRLQTWESYNIPIFYIQFNQSVTRASLENSIYFIDDEGKKYSASLQNTDKASHRFTRFLSDHHGHKWLAKPKQALPKEKNFSLLVEPGIQPSVGSETSVQTLEPFRFKTFGTFKFLGIQCHTTNKKRVTIHQNNQAKHKCNPEAPLVLLFNNPIDPKMLDAKALKISPNLPHHPQISWRTSQHPNANNEFELYLHAPWQPNTSYKITASKGNRFFLTRWIGNIVHFFKKNGQTKHTFVDHFSQRLSNTLEGSFRTGHYQPKLDIPLHYVVMDSHDQESAVTLKTRNIQSLTYQYQQLKAPHKRTHQTFSLKLGTNKPDQFTSLSIPSEELFSDTSGVTLGYVRPFPAIEDSSRHQRLLCTQLTPFLLSAKVGRNEVFVSLLDSQTKSSVSGANIAVIQWDPSQPKGSIQFIQKATTNESGLATLLLDQATAAKLYDGKHSILAQHHEQLALLPLRPEFQHILPVNMPAFRPLPTQNNDTVAWGFSEQTFYRPGETVHYQIFLRTSEPLQPYYQLEVLDPDKTVVHKKVLHFSEFGTAKGAFRLQKNAQYGQYIFLIQGGGASHPETIKALPLSILVTDVHQTSILVNSTLNAANFYRETPIALNIHARFAHNGAPLKNTSAIVYTTFEPQVFVPQNRFLRNFTFAQIAADSTSKTAQQQIKLDKKGEKTLHFGSTDLVPKNAQYGVLKFDTVIADESGKYHTRQDQATYSRSTWLAGIKLKQELSEDHTLSGNIIVESVVIDRQEKRVEGVETRLMLFHASEKGKWKKLATCHTISDAEKVLNCHFTLKKRGLYKVTANIKDQSKQPYTSEITFFHSDADHYLFLNPQEEGSFSIHAEQPLYHVGDTAHYFVYNPYEKATGLVTLEREHVIDSFEKTIDSGYSILEIPITSQHQPGFHLGILLNHRSNEKNTTSLAMASSPVINPAEQLKLSVEPSKTSYEPGETVEINASVLNHTDEEFEITALVIDHNHLRRISQEYLDLDIFKHFNNFESPSMQTFSLYRHHPQGRSGGIPTPFSARSSNHEIHLTEHPATQHWGTYQTKNGKVTIRFKNANVSGLWDVVVLATNKGRAFGTGQTHYTTNNPVQIVPKLPAAIKTKDTAYASFTIYNHRPVPGNFQSVVTIGDDDYQHKSDLNIAAQDSALITIPIDPALFSSREELPIVLQVTDALDHTRYTQEHSIAISCPAPSHHMHHQSFMMRDRDIQKTLDIPPTATDLSFTFYRLSLESYLTEPLKPSRSWSEFLKEFSVASINALILHDPVTLESLSSHIDKMLALHQDVYGGIHAYPNNSATEKKTCHQAMLTAQTLIYLTKLEHYGVILDPNFVQRMQQYVQSCVQDETSSPLTNHTYLLRALSLRDSIDDPLLVALHAKRQSMALRTLADYLLLLHQSDCDQVSEYIQEVLELLLSTSVMTPSTFSFLEPDERNSNFSSQIQSHCTVLEALLLFPETPISFNLLSMVPKLAWYVAANDQRLSLECLHPLYLYKKDFQGEEAQTIELLTPQEAQHFTLDQNTMTVSVSLTDRSDAQSFSYQLQKDKAPPVYYGVDWFDATESTPENFIRIERNLWVLEGQRFVKSGNEASLKVGDIVMVTLQLYSPINVASLSIEDDLSGGLKLLPELKVLESMVPREKGVHYSNITRMNHVLLEDQQHMMIQTHHLKNSRIYTVYYFAQSYAPGVFHVNPPAIRHQWFPDIRGQGKASLLSITA